MLTSLLSAGDADAEVAGVELITGMVGTAVCVSIKLGCGGGADENVLAAVSYTHLDVYKRQMYS